MSTQSLRWSGICWPVSTSPSEFLCQPSTHWIHKSVSINRSIGIVNLTVLKMQLELSVGSKSLIGRCELCMFHLPKDKIYVNLTVPYSTIIVPPKLKVLCSRFVRK